MQRCSKHLLTSKYCLLIMFHYFEDASLVCFDRIRILVYLEHPAFVFELVPTFGHPLVTNFFHLRRCWSRPSSCCSVPLYYSGYLTMKGGRKLYAE